MDISIPKIRSLSGAKQVPGDKSISHRALMIGAIADGITEVQACSSAADPLSTLACIKQLGINVDNLGERIVIYGKGRYGLHRSNVALDAGNSGTTMRLLSGILVGQRFPSVLAGDPSLSRRPMKRIIEPLRQMGANIQGTERNTAPIEIKPVSRLEAIRYEMLVSSAQVKSALIFAGIFAEGKTEILEKSQTRDHTERMLGLQPTNRDGRRIIEINSDIKIEGKKYFVPGDISAAAFFLAAGLIVPDSNLKILNVGLNPTRRRILDIFKIMNGNITIENERIIEGEPIADLVVKHSELKSNLDLRGEEVVEIIDEIPILSVTAMFAEGSFSIHDAQELRAKETDRISAIVHNLRLTGLDVEEYQDGFAFEGKKTYSGNMIPSFGDHRIAMSFGIAGLRIPDIIIQNAECVDISFPGFWEELFEARIS